MMKTILQTLVGLVAIGIVVGLVIIINHYHVVGWILLVAGMTFVILILAREIGKAILDNDDDLHGDM